MPPTSRPELVAGPMLRFVGETSATVWVETSARCEVAVLGARAPTITVGDHYYAVVSVEDLEPGMTYEYEVSLDGALVWPQDGEDFPPSRIRTLLPDQESLRIVFGSCRISAPHEPPYVLAETEHPNGRGVDALRTYALELIEAPPRQWPDLLLMLGDQIYSDDLSPKLQEITRAARGGQGRIADELVTFEEFARAYAEAWTEPVVRWLLSTVPTAMVFDDHEIRSGWRTSQTSLDAMREEDRHDERLASGLTAYWLYQHLGNLSPEQLRADELLTKAYELDDAEPVLRDFAVRADQAPENSRWSFCRSLGGCLLVVIDSRAARTLDPGARDMVNADEWEWIHSRTRGDYNHVLLASSVPFLLGRGLQHFEAWNEAVCDGAWGRRAARVGEWIRQQAKLDHWASFNASFRRIAALLAEMATGARGKPPASVLMLSGDVHHGYTAPVSLRGTEQAGTSTAAGPPRSAVWQLVCSPFRKNFPMRYRRTHMFAESRVAQLIGRALTSMVKVTNPPLDWEINAEPSLNNQIATLELQGRRAVLRIATTSESDWRSPRLHQVLKADLTPTRHGQGLRERASRADYPSENQAQEQSLRGWRPGGRGRSR